LTSGLAAGGEGKESPFLEKKKKSGMTRYKRGSRRREQPEHRFYADGKKREERSTFPLLRRGGKKEGDRARKGRTEGREGPVLSFTKGVRKEKRRVLPILPLYSIERRKKKGKKKKRRNTLWRRTESDVVGRD